jgi:hypothetical protein
LGELRRPDRDARRHRLGESVVFVTEPLKADGSATAAISTPVVSITQVDGDQAAPLRV